ETADFGRQPLADLRDFRADDSDFLLERRMFDVQVQTPPSQGIADLTAAIRREDDVRWVLGADRPELRNRHLKIRQDLEQERLEALVRAIDLVDEQDRRGVRSGD